MTFCVDIEHQPCVKVDGQTTEPLAFAAHEMKRYLELILGASLPEQSDRAIVLSVTPQKVIDDEGYLIEVGADRVSVIGGGDAGVVYGTYEFLRRYGGCVFSNPGPDGEYVPRLTRLEIAPECIKRSPILRYRGTQVVVKYPVEQYINQFDWMAKNGLNYVMFNPNDFGIETIDPKTGAFIEGMPRFSNQSFRNDLLPEIRKRGLKLDMSHHNLYFWLPPSKYFKCHPEWYALINGKRSDKALQLCICTSNHEAVTELIRNIKTYLRANPEVGIVGVIQEDGMGYCTCDKCLKLDGSDEALKYRPEYFQENRFIIRRYALLVNEVARELRKEFPDILVESAHYTDLVAPPEDIPVEANRVPVIAMYWQCGAHPLDAAECATNLHYADIIRRWRRVFPGKIILYAYYCGMNGQRALPYPMAKNICREWDWLKDMGIHGATLQTHPAHLAVYGLNYMAFARSGWERIGDYNALMDDFLKGMFGAAASTIKPIYDKFEEAIVKIAAGRVSHPALGPFSPDKSELLPTGHNIVFFLDFIGLDFIAACVNQALRAAQTDREKRQVMRFKQATTYWKLSYEYFQQDLRLLRLKNLSVSNEELKEIKSAHAIADSKLKAHHDLHYYDGWCGYHLGFEYTVIKN